MSAIHAARAMRALASNTDNTDAWEGTTAKAWGYLTGWDRIGWCVLAHIDYRQSGEVWDALEPEERRRLRVTMLNMIKLFAKIGEGSEKNGKDKVPAVPGLGSDPKPGGPDVHSGALAGEGKLPS